MRIRRKIVLFLLLLVCFIVQGTFLKVIAIGSISPNLSFFWIYERKKNRNLDRICMWLML